MSRVKNALGEANMLNELNELCEDLLDVVFVDYFPLSVVCFCLLCVILCALFYGAA